MPGFSIYQTEEMMSFLDWIRTYNKSQPQKERIGVFGFDVQSIDGPASALVDWLEHQAPEEQSLSASLSALSGGMYDGGNINHEQLQRAERLLPELQKVIDTTGKTSSTCALSETDHWGRGSQESVAHPIAAATPGELTEQYLLRAFEQAVEFARAYHDEDESVSYGLRDEFMAANIAWMHDYTQAAKMAVWAHDNHVKTGRLSGDGSPSKTMGEHLRSLLGTQYYALGLQFVTGEVRGYVPSADGNIEIDGETLEMDVVEVPDPIDGSIPDLLDKIDASQGLLNLRVLPESSSAREWLSDARFHHYLAGRIEPDDRRRFYREHRTIAVFDGLGFVTDTTPTTPL